MISVNHLSLHLLDYRIEITNLELSSGHSNIDPPAWRWIVCWNYLKHAIILTSFVNGTHEPLTKTMNQ